MVEVASRPVVTRLPSESTVTKPSVEYAGVFAGSFEAAGSEEAALEELAAWPQAARFRTIASARTREQSFLFMLCLLSGGYTGRRRTVWILLRQQDAGTACCYRNKNGEAAPRGARNESAMQKTVYFCKMRRLVQLRTRKMQKAYKNLARRLANFTKTLPSVLLY